MIELGHQKPDEQVINGIDKSVSEWPIIGEIPHHSVNFVAVHGGDWNIRQQVQRGDLEIIAENSDKHPNWMIKRKEFIV